MSRRSRFNKLSAAEEERLALLLEEMGETIQIIGTIKRHGFESRHPNGGPTNRELLQTELGHVKYSQLLMHKCGDIDLNRITVSAVQKSFNVGKYLHHQPVNKITLKVGVAGKRGDNR